jgi:hypothetical protein
MDEPDAPLTPLEAAAAIREVAGWTERLARRIEALTWLLWAIVIPAISMTYAFAASTMDDQPWLGLLWAPWVALGVLATGALWRTTRIVPRMPTVSRRELAVHMALFLLVTVGMAPLVVKLGLPVPPPTAAGFGLGLLTAMIGVRQAYGAQRRGGLVVAIGGMLLIAVAVAEAVFLTGGPPLEQVARAALVNAFAVPLVFVGIALWKLTFED